MIEKQYVLNLKIRPDRLREFQSSLPEKLGLVEPFAAVHGDSCLPPAWWGAGNGAWGCYRSHLQILETVMSNDIQSYMVFEDDAVFVKDFDSKYESFLDELPPDWDMFYLGGALMHTDTNPPEKISDNVFRPYNVNRTHCFAVNRKAYRYLYDFLLRRFESREWHIDHHMGRIHEQREINVYCPAEWLVGQKEGSSNIDGKVHPTRFFANPISLYRKASIAVENYCIVLSAPYAVVQELVSANHWHCGFDKDENGVDKGLRNLEQYSKQKIRQWWYYIKRESVSHGKVPFIWHPYYDVMKAELPFKPVRIEGCTTKEVLEKYKSETSSLIG